MRTNVQTALSSVIGDIQVASIAQWLEPLLSVPVVVGLSLGGGIKGYARHKLKKQN